MSRTTEDVATAHGLTEERGFLPEEDPLAAFDADRHRPAVADYLDELDAVAAALPDHLEDGDVRPVVRSVPAPPERLLEDLNRRETVRTCLVAGFLASAYVNEIGAEPVDRLPAGAAVPLYRCSRKLGRKPILSYDLLCLHNFRREDPDEGFAVEDLDTVQQFTRLDDERWFVAIHVAIEAAAGPALVACSRAQVAALDDDPGSVLSALETVADSLEDQTSIMRRMTEGNDPEAFAHEFRPYYKGFDGVVYEGVEELDGQPQTLRGGSGAQSSVLPAIDATLGIDHEVTDLTEKLGDMRSYMPERHRSAVEVFDDGPDLREYVADSGDRRLESAFNRCVEELTAFREIHFGQVIQYIREMTGDATGTGGTEFMPFLGKLREETEAMKF